MRGSDPDRAIIIGANSPDLFGGDILVLTEPYPVVPVIPTGATHCYHPYAALPILRERRDMKVRQVLI